MKVALHHEKGIVSRRSSIKRAVLAHERSDTISDMSYIPDALKFFPDGPLFVHYMEPTLHVYYSSKSIQMAVRNGLHSLVADGVHSCQPRQLRRQGQLYTVHEVCNNGIEVYGSSTKKTEQVYSTIFRNIREEFEATGPRPQPLREDDFEHASITAAKRVFPLCDSTGLRVSPRAILESETRQAGLGKTSGWRAT